MRSVGNGRGNRMAVVSAAVLGREASWWWTVSKWRRGVVEERVPMKWVNLIGSVIHTWVVSFRYSYVCRQFIHPIL